MVRYVALNECKNINDIKNFNLEGYTFIKETNDELHFKKIKIQTNTKKKIKK